MRFTTLFLCFGLCAASAACAATSNDGDGAETAEAAVAVGGVSGAILQDMRVRHPREEGKTWAVTRGNAVAADDILPVPLASSWGNASLPRPARCTSSGACDPDFSLARCSGRASCGGPCIALEATKKSDGDVPTPLCVGHSDAFLDDLWRQMTSAHHILDVTSLTAPDGRFLAAMRNAVTTLDRRGEPVVVRFLFGEFPGGAVDVEGTLAALTRDVRTGSRLQVAVAAHRAGLTTWNHSKIVAADGVSAIVSGMNMWSDHYLDAAPVHDLSLRVKGSAAASAQTFANALWQVACAGGRVAMRGGGSRCPSEFVPPPAKAAGNVQVLALGRLGTHRDATREALVLAMNTASRRIRMSQQDIGSFKIPGGVLVADYVHAWVMAARRNVDVDIVLSNEGAFGGLTRSFENTYFNGWSFEELWREISRAADATGFTDVDLQAQLCKHLHLYRFRSSASATWSGGRPYANHAKVVVIDDDAYYVGSQNLYDGNVAEFGFLVDDRQATRTFLSTYFDKLMAFSSPTVYRDPSCRR